MRRIFALAVFLLLPTSVWAQPYSTANPGAYWVAPGLCQTSVSGNATGTQGLTSKGASNTPVVQASTSVTGTNTHTYICNISPPQAIITSRTGVAIQDAVFVYGMNAGLAAQVNNLASGTFNGSQVFSLITMPTAGASETPSTVTPVRADTGSMVITPVVTSFNVTTTTDGSFFTAKFTPSTPITWKADYKQLLLTVTLQASGSIATVSYSPGVLVHLVSK